MKSLLKFIVPIAVLFLSAGAQGQNWTTVSASNITDLNQNKLAAGQLCFLATDQNDNPISFSVGGGGQVLKRAYCSTVSSGAVTAFSVPNPPNATPAGIYYRVTVKDTSTGQEVLRYTQVTFSGGAFSFDNYTPNLPGAALNPLSGNSVTGNLSVSGNANITGSLAVSGFNPTVLTSGQFTSNTANPAGAGILRLASGDAIDWRNNANSANVPLQKTGAASGGVPADTLDASGFGGVKFTAPLFCPEGPAPSGVASADALYCDSTAHRWKMINNNGAADTVLGAATTDTLTNKTLTSPVINGTPAGTGMPTLTLKKGSGSGNYSTTSTSSPPTTQVDGTNLVYTATIPTGWKLAVDAYVIASTLTGAATCTLAIDDGGSAIAETTSTPAGVGQNNSMALGSVITGDGNSHSIDLRYSTNNGSDACQLLNSSSVITPQMRFILTPSN